MNDSELFLLIKKVLWADSYQELAGIINANPELLEQKTFDTLMGMARQAREEGQNEFNEYILSALSKIAPFAVSKNEAEQNPSSQTISPNTTWTSKVRKCLALRKSELLYEAIAEAQEQTEIVSFIQAFANQNLSEIDRIADTLIPKLYQTNRREEALTINLLYLDVRAGLAEGQHLRFPVKQQKEMRELGIKSCQQAIQIAQTLNDKPCEAIYLLRLAGGFNKASQYREAEQFYAQALPIYQNLAEHEPQTFKQFVAMSLDGLGAVQSDLRKLADSEKSHLEAVQIYQSLNQQESNSFMPELAMAMTNLGTVQRALWKLTEAEKTLTEALQIKRILAIPKPHIFNQSVAITLTNLAAVQLDLRKLADAEISYSEALAIYRKLAIPEPQVFNRSVAMALHNLGVVQKDLRRLTDAEKLLLEALQIRQTLALYDPHSFNQDVATTLNELGNVQIELRKLAEAEKYFNEALQIRRALAFREPEIFNQSLAATLSNLGVLQYELFKLDDAENSLTEALQIRRALAAKDPNLFNAEVATTLTNLGLVQSSLQKRAEAENSYIEALQIYQKLAEEEPHIFNQSVVRTLNNLGYLKFKQNNLDKAEEFLESARNLIEDLRAKAITIDDRYRILQENIPIYDNLLACYISMKNWQKALEIAELGKSRSLSDLLNLKSEDLQPKAPNADTLAIVKDLGQKYSDAIKELQRFESYEKYLSQQLNRFESDIKRIEDDNDNDDDTRQSFLRQIVEQKQPLEQEKRSTQEQRFAQQSLLKNVLQEINKYDQSFPPKAKAINPESIFEISRNLNRVIVIFRLLEKSTAIIFVFPSGDLHIEEIEDFSEREMFYLFQDNWLTPYQQRRYKETDIKNWERAIEQTLEIIYEKLIFRVHQILWGKSDCKEVLFVPNKSLALLPLHAASWREADGKKHYLLEEFTISYAPSVSVFKRCLENEKPRSNKTLFVTNPNQCDIERHEKSFACAEMLIHGRYNSHLDSSEKEVSFIEKLHTQRKNLLGKDATKSAVIEALREDYGFTHFSCHGFYNQANPFESGLVMSDEVIKLSEIINSNLTNNWLTTLSACETGMVDFGSPTDEHFGLPLGFIFAGSPSVWASLWSVSDMATAELMKTAYENLSLDEYKNNKPEALRQAQLAVLKHLPHPFFWAGFQHFGV